MSSVDCPSTSPAPWAVQITEELSFGIAALGLAVAIQRIASAGAANPLGRLADRIGSTWSLRISVTLSASAMFGIAATAHRWWNLVLWMSVGSVSLMLGQPAANRLLARTVAFKRLGTAFGFKQSRRRAVASLLAGLSVPFVAQTIGWRWAYVLGGSVAIALLPAIGRRASPRPPRPQVSRRAGPLPDQTLILMLAVALGLASASSSVVSAFYVDAAVRAGSQVQTAGFLLAVASGITIAVRMLSGAACDRLPKLDLRLNALLLVVGSGGLLLLATGRPATMNIGVILALTGTWGGNGVYWYAVIRAFPDAPGRISGALAPGGLIGGIVALSSFGIIAERIGHGAAWIAASFAAVGGSIMMTVAARRIRARAANALVQAGQRSEPIETGQEPPTEEHP